MKEEAVSIQKSFASLVSLHQRMKTSVFKASALKKLKTKGDHFFG